MNIVKNVIQNYEWANMEDIENVLGIVIKEWLDLYGIDAVYSFEYDDGGKVKKERTSDGKIQIEIGILPFCETKENKELNGEAYSAEERKEFIELILQVFHELRHSYQIHNIIDAPINNNDTFGMTREFVINEVFPGFINRYNYEYAMSEVDAMKHSLVEAVTFFTHMESDITREEVIAVMKEKELKYLNYDLSKFGNSYQSTIEYFDFIYTNPVEIKGYPEMLGLLSDEEKMIYRQQCNELHTSYMLEQDANKKMDILMGMALRIRPELYHKYPILNILDSKQR